MRSKKLIAVLLVAAMGISQFNVALADKKSEAENAKKRAEENLKSKQNEIDNIEQEQGQLQEEINALDAELVNVIVELSTLEEELSIKQDELAQTKENLKQAKEDEKNQYEAMKLRIRFMYEKGDSAMLTSILESRSIADLLNRVEYVNQVYDYDRNLLTQYETTKKQVAKLQKQQKKEVAALEQKRQEFQAAEENYRVVIAQKKEESTNFDHLLAEAQSLAAQYQDTINAQNVIIAQENEREERERREREERERQERLAQQERERQEIARRQSQVAQNNTRTDSSDEADDDSSSSGNSGNAGTEENGSQEAPPAASDSGNKNPDYSTGVSGSSVVQYAMNFVGNPYVWGGKDPNTGADCSGFTSYVYAHFGISIPSYSYSQRSVGKEVSYANAQAGDLICYNGHVAIYMGNGQIVHAKGTAYGIVAYDNATYRPIITVRRVL
ncbi:MAG: hydrolase [Lachnospiraceae bacterium]|nr:hydrolase [Lachnospiraceae bacterium]